MATTNILLYNYSVCSYVSVHTSNLSVLLHRLSYMVSAVGWAGSRASLKHAASSDRVWACSRCRSNRRLVSEASLSGSFWGDPKGDSVVFALDGLAEIKAGISSKSILPICISGGLGTGGGLVALCFLAGGLADCNHSTCVAVTCIE